MHGANLGADNWYFTLHLNNLNVYEPLHIDISPTLKELITEKLKALKNNGLLKQAWFEFCKPPKQTRTSMQTLFLEKNSQESHGNKTNRIQL